MTIIFFLPIIPKTKNLHEETANNIACMHMETCLDMQYLPTACCIAYYMLYVCCTVELHDSG